MARYGVSVYGESFYGIPSTSLFAADPVVCQPTDYGSILLTWHSPGGSWDELVVVRNFAGYPAAPDNGVTVASFASGADLGEFREDGLTTDQWVYYSIFVHDPIGVTWVRSGNGRCFVPRNYAGSDRMAALLPSQMQSDALLRFLQIIGFNYDLLRNDGYTLLDLYDTKRMSYDLVPVLMEQFGIPREYELEPEQYRRFLRNAVRLYKTKGTSECAHGVVSAVTGWDSVVTTGVNLLWDSDFSDFAGSTAYWSRGAVNCNITYVPVSTDDLGETVPPAMRLTAVGTGDIETSFVDLATDVSDLHRLALPVAVGAPYFASAAIRGSDIHESNAHLELRWYDLSGALLSTSSGSAVATRQFVDVALTAGGTAPTNAVWMVPVVVVVAAHASSYWEVRTMQVSRSSQLLPHEPGRDIRITLKANRINEVLNGSFETNTYGWVADGNAGIAQDGSQSFVGSKSLAITYTGAGVTDGGPLPADRTHYSFATIPGRRYGVQVEVAHDGAGSPLNYVVAATNSAVTNILLDSDGSFAAAQTDTDGVANHLSGDHDQPAFAFLAEEATTAIVIGFIDAVTGAVLHADAVIVEIADTGSSLDWQIRNPDFVKPYFDGSVESTTFDYFWQGTPFASRSHFYDRRIVHEQRLRAILPRYLPFGATFTLLFAQAGGVVYMDEDTVLVDVDPPPPTSTVGRTLALRWDNEFDSAALLALRWDVRVPVGRSVGLEWDDRADVGHSESLVWRIRVVVGRSGSEVWDDRVDVGKSGSELWNVAVDTYLNGDSILT